MDKRFEVFHYLPPYLRLLSFRQEHDTSTDWVPFVICTRYELKPTAKTILNCAKMRLTTHVIVYYV